VFFQSAWARYEDAKPGTLRVVPPEHRRGELERDCERMQEMIFGEAPTFDHILQQLGVMENEINHG
jgi:hypothetical protein